MSRPRAELEQANAMVITATAWLEVGEIIYTNTCLAMPRPLAVAVAGVPGSEGVQPHTRPGPGPPWGSLTEPVNERTTDTEEAAHVAAEPIHGCSTTPMGMKTPGRGRTTLRPWPRQTARRAQPRCPPNARSSSGQLRSLQLGAGQVGPGAEAGAGLRAGRWGRASGGTESPPVQTFLGLSRGGITGLGEAPEDRAPQGPLGQPSRPSEV